MSGASISSTDVATTTISQLEGSLQLAMAVRNQLTERGAVCRNDVRVAMESFGLTLPSSLPEASFTQLPTNTNYHETLELVRLKEAQLASALEDKIKQEFLEQVGDCLHLLKQNEVVDLSESLYRHVQGIGELDFNVAAVQGADPLIMTEVARCGDALAGLNQNALGQKLLTTLRPSCEFNDKIGQVLCRRFDVMPADAAMLIHDIDALRKDYLLASVVEPDVEWTSKQWVVATVAASGDYSTPLSAQFQHCISHLQALQTDPDQIRDLADWKNRLALASAVHDWLALRSVLLVAWNDTVNAVATVAKYLKRIHPFVQ